MSDSESDIEIKSALPKKNYNLLKIPANEPKIPANDSKIPANDLKIPANDSKKSTKSMIIEALTELKSRKGVSVQAIKKHLKLKYQIDTEKYNHLVKRSLKSGVEDGTFVQLKGIGASGSFKLANLKEKVSKPKKKTENSKKKETENSEKIETEKGEKKKKTGVKKVTERKKEDVESNDESGKPWKGKGLGKSSQPIEVKESKKKKEKNLEKKEMKKVQAKVKKPMIKRKSIGNIIKPPKMKPKKT